MIEKTLQFIEVPPEPLRGGTTPHLHADLHVVPHCRF